MKMSSDKPKAPPPPPPPPTRNVRGSVPTSGQKVPQRKPSVPTKPPIKNR